VNQFIDYATGLSALFASIIGSLACAYELAHAASNPPSSSRLRRAAVLGFILTIWEVFALSLTRFAFLAAAIIPAPILFAILIVRPGTAKKNYVRVYLAVCLILFAIFYLWSIAFLLLERQNALVPNNPVP
jgi:hypothetical protein